MPKGERNPSHRPSKSEQPLVTKSSRWSRCSFALTTELICRSAIAPAYASSPAWYKFLSVVAMKSRRRTRQAAAAYLGHRQRPSPYSEQHERAAVSARARWTRPATRKVDTTSSRKTKRTLEEAPPIGVGDVNATPTSTEASKAPGISSTTAAATTLAARRYRPCSRSRSAFGIRGVAKTATCGGKPSDSFERSRRRGRKRDASHLLRTCGTSIGKLIEKNRPSSCRRQRASSRTSSATTVTMSSGEALNTVHRRASGTSSWTSMKRHQAKNETASPSRELPLSDDTAWSSTEEMRGWRARGRSRTASFKIGNSIARALATLRLRSRRRRCVEQRKDVLNEAKLDDRVV